MQDVRIAEQSSARGATALGPEALVRFFAAAIVVVLIPWLLLASSEPGGRGHVWFVYLVVAAWAGGHLAAAIATGEPRLYTFMFWVFTYLFCGIAPMVQFRTGELASTTRRLSTDHDVATAVVVVLGVAAFEIGSLLSRTRRGADAADPRHPVDEPVLDRPDNLPALITLAASTLVSVYYVSKVGFGEFFTSRDEIAAAKEAVFADPTVSAILAGLSWVPAVVVIHRIAAGRWRRHASGYRLSGPEVLALVVAVATIVVTNNPLTSSRYSFGSMVLSFVVLAGGVSTTRRTRRTFIALILSLLVLFPVADAFRREHRGSFQVSLVNEYPGNPDYDAVGQIHNAVTVVESEGLSYLRQPSGALLFWVPRSVWADKPIDTGAYLAEARGYRYVNLSAPLWAELYLMGGNVTVGLGFALLGFALGRLDAKQASALLAGGYSVVGAFMPFYLIIILRGALLQAMALATTFVITATITRPRQRTRER